MGIIPVQINDAVFSLHAIVLSTITAIQCAIYEVIHLHLRTPITTLF